MGNRHLLEIVIPTYNRPQCIEYQLDYFEKYFDDRYDVLISIFDSSTDNATFEVVEKYKFSKLTYQRINSDMDIDEKTVLALKAANAKYVMLLGDGLIVDIEKIFNQINLNDVLNDIILLYDTTICGKEFYQELKKVYTDKNEFFEKNFFRLTTYGASICSNSIIKNIEYDKMVLKFNKLGFIYPCSLAIYSSGPYTIKVGDFLKENPYKISSGWIQDKRAIEIWTKNFQKSVYQLDGYLRRDVINNIIKSRGAIDSFFTVRGLIKLRISGNYSLKLRRKYKQYLYKSLCCSKISAFFIALMPKFIARMLYGSYKKFKRS